MDVHIAKARRRFSSALTGPWKNALKMECILFASPGARVGHAWLNFAEMNGRVGDSDGWPGLSDFDFGCDCGGRGMAIGRFGFAVADVGRGGRARTSGVIPGMKSVTTLAIARGFCTS